MAAAALISNGSSQAVTPKAGGDKGAAKKFSAHDELQR